MKLDHIGIAVKSVDDALKTYQDRLGFAVTEVVTLAEQKVRAAILPAGDCVLELLEPTAPDSPIQRFIQKRGEGVHHLCFQVEDIRETVEVLQAASMTLVDLDSDRGLADRQVAFVHPKSANGVLIELVEVKTRGSDDSGHWDSSQNF